MTHRAVQMRGTMLIGGLVVMVFATLLQGQQRGVVINNFRFAEPYDPPLQNQTKYLLMGTEGRALGEGKVLLKEFRMETFARTGERQTISSAPECVVDTVNRTVNSAGPMQMQTADGKFVVRGEGFLLRQTNLSLVISNNVETTIHKELLAAKISQLKSAGQPATNSPAPSVPPAATPTAANETNQFTKIFADHLDFSSVSNLAVYSGDVRVVDPQMGLTCEIMMLRRSTNGSLESIVAEPNVVIVSKLDRSRAAGEKAVYIVNPESETVELIGNAHWQDDQYEVKADTFLLDRRANTVYAAPNAYLTLPRSALNQPGPLSAKSIAPDSARAATNEFIEITSQGMSLQLPTTNRPARILIAETNVVIVSPADHSRATCDEAVYTEANGTFRLSGHAVWRSEQREVRGDTLTFDRPQQIFTARSNAYLRLPVTALGKSTFLAAKNAGNTNQFIELFSDFADYRENVLNFRGSVRVNFLEGEEMHGWLTCDFLTAEFTNHQVKIIVARGRVAAGQVPATAETARRVYKQLNCEILTVNFSTHGQAERFVAEQKVEAKQDEVRAGTNTIHTTLTADVVTGYFFPKTNLVEKIVAAGNFFVAQGERSGKGNQAVYTATNDLVVLTGEPTATMPEGRITDVETLIWDRANEKLSARGLSARGRFKSALVLGGGTNQTTLRFPK